jgi:hypothetical protein
MCYRLICSSCELLAVLIGAFDWKIKDPSHNLDPMPRLNYAKLYTVEHNVKVEK